MRGSLRSHHVCAPGPRPRRWPAEPARRDAHAQPSLEQPSLEQTRVAQPATERALALALLALAACGPTRPEPISDPPPSQPTAATDPEPESDLPRPQGPWAECYQNLVAPSKAAGALANLTRACGSQGGMKAVTPVHTGSQSEKDPVDRFSFKVPRGGNCYRVYAAADASIEDLDLLLRDPQGNPLAGDITHDAWPVLPPSGPICFDTPGLYLLEVSVYRGQGEYALQVWASEGQPGSR